MRAGAGAWDECAAAHTRQSASGFRRNVGGNGGLPWPSGFLW
jgi:hypothetical protein